MDRNMLIAVGIGGALIYIAASGRIRGVAGTAAVAVGAITIARRLPVVNEYVG